MATNRPDLVGLRLARRSVVHAAIQLTRCGANSMSLRYFGTVLVAMSLVFPVHIAAQSRIDTLRVGVLFSPQRDGHARPTAVSRGIDLGLEEARRTAALFGLVLELVPTHRINAPPLRMALRDPRRIVSAIIIAHNKDECGAPSDAGTGDAVVITLDCNPGLDAVSPCERRVFHIAPSAITQRRARDVALRGRGADRSADSRIVLWHHTLARFGAEQLNERFRRRFAAEMDSHAWSAWAAMKILSEAALRARTTRGAEIARYLARPAARFDGHKGEPLTFDARTGELRQPLYAIAGGADTERVETEMRSAAIFLSDDGVVCTADDGGDSDD